MSPGLAATYNGQILDLGNKDNKDTLPTHMYARYTSHSTSILVLAGLSNATYTPPEGANNSLSSDFNKLDGILE